MIENGRLFFKLNGPFTSPYDRPHSWKLPYSLNLFWSYYLLSFYIVGVETVIERTQNMYDLLYAGQISVDTRATRRQQRIALKRLKKSNLNLRPSKIRELAKQMKKEAENGADTISSGIESGQTETDSYDISKAESNDTETKGNISTLKSWKYHWIVVEYIFRLFYCQEWCEFDLILFLTNALSLVKIEEKYILQRFPDFDGFLSKPILTFRIWIKSFLEKVGQSSAMNRLMARLGLKGGSQDSAVGMSSRSSIGSFEGGPSSRDPIPHVTIAGGGPTTRRAQVHNYGGAQF